MSHAKANLKHKKKCQDYRKSETRLFNKQKKITRHLKKHPNDLQAKTASH